MNVVGQVDFDNFRQMYHEHQRYYDAQLAKLSMELVKEKECTSMLQGQIDDIYNRQKRLIEQLKPLLSPMELRKLTRSQ